MVRRLLTLLLFMGVGAASAQETDTMFPGLELPDPISWLSEVHRFVTANGFHTGMIQIGWAVLFVGFLVGLSRVAYYASEGEWWAVYARLLLGMVILVNASPIQQGTLSTWNGLYTWSSNLNGETIQTDLEQGALEVGALLGPILIVGGGAAMFGGRIAAGTTAAGNAGLVNGVKVAKFGGGQSLGLFTRVLMYAFLPVFSIYAALVFLSGLTILLGMLLLPLAGAMAVFPGGLSWWGRWFGMITGGLVNILVLPILFNIVILLGMLGPMDVMQSGLQRASDSLQGIVGGIDGTASLDDPAFPRDPRKISGYLLDKLYGDIMAPIEALEHVIGGWILSLVALVMGMLIALYLMRNFDRVITGFIGGIAGGVVPSLGGGRGGGKTPSLSGGGGGGGSTGVGGGGGGAPALGAGGGGGSALATASSGGIRSVRGGGGDDAIIDVESREVSSLPSSGRGALGSGSKRALGSGS
jgi:hypothetical protein